MNYTHFTIAERTKIEVYLGLGYGIRRIAKLLNRAPSSVSRELKRNPNYRAEKAQDAYHKRKANCGAPSKLTPAIKETVEEKLKQTWSPEQIIGRLFKGKLSFKTIYRWLYAGMIDLPLTALRQKGKKTETKGNTWTL